MTPVTIFLVTVLVLTAAAVLGSAVMAYFNMKVAGGIFDLDVEYKPSFILSLKTYGASYTVFLLVALLGCATFYLLNMVAIPLILIYLIIGYVLLMFWCSSFFGQEIKDKEDKEIGKFNGFVIYLLSSTATYVVFSVLSALLEL